MLYNTEEIRHTYKSKYNLKRESNFVNDYWWWKMALSCYKKLSALLRGVTSKHDGNFCCLDCIQSYTTKNKLEKHYKIWKNHDYCYVDMPNEDSKILKQNHGEKSMKFLFVIYADLKCLLEKMNTPHNNPEKMISNRKK